MNSKTIFLGIIAALLVTITIGSAVYLASTPQTKPTLSNDKVTTTTTTTQFITTGVTSSSPGQVTTPTISNDQVTTVTTTNQALPSGIQVSPLEQGSTISTDMHVLSVSGTGVVGVQPDRAKIQMTIVTQATTAQKASALNADESNALLNALLAAGIPKNQIETVNYNIYPVYDYSNTNKGPFITGYQASNVVIVTVISTQNGDLGKTASVNNAEAVSLLRDRIFVIIYDEYL